MTIKRFVDDVVFTLRYDFTYEGVRIEKTVEFFIGMVVDDNHTLQETEVKEAGWFSLADAAERLDYQDTKKVFVKARKFLESYRP